MVRLDGHCSSIRDGPKSHALDATGIKSWVWDGEVIDPVQGLLPLAVDVRLQPAWPVYPLRYWAIRRRRGGLVEQLSR